MARPLECTSTPGIYRRENRYVVIVRDERGRQTKRVVPTLSEARTVKALLTADVARGEHISRDRVTFTDYCAEWCDTYGGRTSAGIRQRTLERYRQQLESFAVPFFGKRQLADIQPRDVKRYMAHLAERGISNHTVRRHICPLRALFATAFEDGLVRANPVAGLRITVGRRTQDEVRNKALSDQQLAKLLQHVGDDHRLLIEFLAETGLRIGEAIELRWGDVDLTARRVRVQRSYSQGIVGPPKSRYGNRSVPLTGVMAEHLEMLGSGSTDSDLVFTNRLGHRVDADNLRARVVKPAAAKAGVPWAAMHTLRHTCASRLFRAGWNAKQVQMVLGHHSPAFTLATYVHLMQDDLPEIDVIAVGSLPAAS